MTARDDFPEGTFNAVKNSIQQRKTFKVLGDVGAPVVIEPSVAQKNDPMVREAVRIAGMAPFHYDRSVDGIAEPWRAHVLWHQGCRRVATLLGQWTADRAKGAGKLPAMFSACGAAVLVTWLPQFRNTDDCKAEQVDVDDEHLAAASAMVQNLLLLLTAQGMGTYWSSGGALKLPGVAKHLGIPTAEKLLAAVFIEYPETQAIAMERKPGKHRGSRSEAWINEVHLQE